LVARLVRNEKVGGSNPPSSTPSLSYSGIQRTKACLGTQTCSAHCWVWWLWSSGN